MTQANPDAGMAGVIHPTRSAAMGRPDLRPESRPGAFLVDVASALVASGALDYRGASVAELERGTMPPDPGPAVGREQARWLDDVDGPAHEAGR